MRTRYNECGAIRRLCCETETVASDRRVDKFNNENNNNNKSRKNNKDNNNRNYYKLQTKIVERIWKCDSQKFSNAV